MVTSFPFSIKPPSVKTNILRSLTLIHPEGCRSVSAIAVSPFKFSRENLKGETAIADTDLHPSGWINVKDRRIFVLTEGGFIEKGKEVTILSVDGNRVLVREL